MKVSFQESGNFLSLGLQRLGIELVAPSDADLIVLQEPEEVDKPYVVFGYEDPLSECSGFTEYVYSCLGLRFASDNGVEFSIEKLLERPHIVHYYGRPFAFPSYKFLENAKLCVARSASEEKAMARDCPSSKRALIPLATSEREPREPFLVAGSYVVQCGNLEERNFQLASILAMRKIDLPLAFVGRIKDPFYASACQEAAKRWRRAPTLFLEDEDCLTAIAHAGLYLEYQPSSLALEAMRFGAPVAMLEKPHHINEIETSIRENFGKPQKPISPFREIDAARRFLELIA